MLSPRAHRTLPAAVPAVPALLERLPAVLVLVLACMLGAVTPAGAAGTSSPAAATTTAPEERMVLLINASRAENGLAPLRVRAGLTVGARSHSASMAGARALFHTTSFARICCWSAIAENVGYGRGVRRLHRILMTSPGHRANILDPRMTEVGVGIVASGGALWVTEVFRQRRS